MPTPPARHAGNLTQRADYTHQHNARLGRHGWLRLTPAYSLKIVEETLADIGPAARVLDPFCGTATTALCAACRGHRATTTEINPFLVWLARAKLACYASHDLQEASDGARQALACIQHNRVQPQSPPPIHNIQRWWEPEALRFLCTLKSALDSLPVGPKPRVLLEVAFCRTLIKLSNAAFNHQSMSFRNPSRNLSPPEPSNCPDAGALFSQDVHFVLNSAAGNPAGEAAVIHGDACALSSVVSGPFDAVITSPPYPNRMSYIRELRPYMYWLGFLRNSRAAGELDWASMGGTWGVATSRLNDWNPSPAAFRPRYLDEILRRISGAGNSSGRLLSQYVAKYFEDAFRHLRSLTQVVAANAQVHYIVGNSTFYDVLLPVEQLYAEMLSRLGFQDVRIKPIRKRNSKKSLVEFDVSGVWPK